MRVSMFLFLLFLLPVAVHAAGAPLSGEALFNSTALGWNGKSCASCHPQGKGLGQIGDYDDAILQEFVNFCIRDAMKGQMLPEGAPELQTLAGYLRQFQSAQ